MKLKSLQVDKQKGENGATNFSETVTKLIILSALITTYRRFVKY
jgi:hypothetical protein